MRLVQLDKLEAWLKGKGYTRTGRETNYTGPLWMKTIQFKNAEGKTCNVNCFCFPHKMPLELTNNVESINYDGERVKIDFRMKFWKDLSLDSNERAVK